MEDTNTLFRNIKSINDKINSQLNRINSNDPYRAKIQIDELRKELSSIKINLNKLENNMIYDKNVDKGELRVQKSEYESLKKKIDNLENEIIQNENLEKLKSGKLKGIEKEKTEKKELENQIGQIEDQGKIIDYIGKDIREANRNIEQAGTTVKEQGERIDNINVKIDDDHHKMGQAEVMENQMIRVAKCHGCLLYFLAAILAIADIILIIVYFI